MENIEQFLEERRKFRTKSGKSKRTKKDNKEKQKKSFFDKIFRQLVITMALMICVFSLRLFPVSQNFFFRVQSAVCIDYSQQVKSVFNNITGIFSEKES